MISEFLRRNHLEDRLGLQEIWNLCFVAWRLGCHFAVLWYLRQRYGDDEGDEKTMVEEPVS